MFRRFLHCSSGREGPEFSHGLNWALAGKGVVVKDKAFQNLNSSQLYLQGATITGTLYFLHSNQSLFILDS